MEVRRLQWRVGEGGLVGMVVLELRGRVMWVWSVRQSSYDSPAAMYSWQRETLLSYSLVRGVWIEVLLDGRRDLRGCWNESFLH